jgi:hypothetical protein
MDNLTWHEKVLDAIEEYGHGDSVEVDCVKVGKVWAVKSDTDDMGFYYVMELTVLELTSRTRHSHGQTFLACTCDGYRYNDKCKHTDRVRR